MSAPPIPLHELLQSLRDQGFVIGVDDYLRVGRLISRDSSWSIEQLKHALRAIVITDVRERAAFDQAFDRFFSGRARAAAADDQAQKPPPPPPPRPRWPLYLAGAAAAVAALALLLMSGDGDRQAQTDSPGAATTRAPDTTPDSPTASTPDSPDQPRPGGADNEPLTTPDGDDDSAAAIEVDELLVPTAGETSGRPTPPPVPARTPEAGRGIAFGLAAAGLVIALGALLMIALGRRRRRSFVKGPWRFKRQVPRAAIGPLYQPLEIEDGAANMTFRAHRDAQHAIDVDGTILETVAAGGYPTLVYAPPPPAPEYAVLEDVSAAARSWRPHYDELFSRLGAEGVKLRRYTFDDAPDQVTTADGRSTRSLNDLAEHVDAIIVIGDGSAGFDPLQDEVPEWVDTLRSFPHRLWLNPLPPARWSHGARAIADAIPMEHGAVQSLAALRPDDDRTADDQRPYPAIIELSPDSDTALAALERHLGAAAFRCLALCAVVSDPDPDVVRWLDRRLELELSDSDRLHLVTLPWMRKRRWPDGLRERLSERIETDDPDAVARARTAFVDLLRDMEPTPGTGAHLEWRLQMAGTGGADADAELAALADSPLHARVERQLARKPDRSQRTAAAIGLLALGAGAYLVAPHLAPPAPGLPEVTLADYTPIGANDTELPRLQVWAAPQRAAAPFIRAEVTAEQAIGGPPITIGDSARTQPARTLSYAAAGEPLALVALVQAPGWWTHEDDGAPPPNDEQQGPPGFTAKKRKSGNNVFVLDEIVIDDGPRMSPLITAAVRELSLGAWPAGSRIWTIRYDGSSEDGAGLAAPGRSLGRALDRAREQLAAASGRRVLLVIGDGHDNALPAPVPDLGDQADQLRELGAESYAVTYRSTPAEADAPMRGLLDQLAYSGNDFVGDPAELAAATQTRMTGLGQDRRYVDYPAPATGGELSVALYDGDEPFLSQALAAPATAQAEPQSALRWRWLAPALCLLVIGFLLRDELGAALPWLALLAVIGAGSWLALSEPDWLTMRAAGPDLDVGAAMSQAPAVDVTLAAAADQLRDEQWDDAIAAADAAIEADPTLTPARRFRDLAQREKRNQERFRALSAGDAAPELVGARFRELDADSIYRPRAIASYRRALDTVIARAEQLSRAPATDDNCRQVEKLGQTIAASFPDARDPLQMAARRCASATDSADDTVAQFWAARSAGDVEAMVAAYRTLADRATDDIVTAFEGTRDDWVKTTLARVDALCKKKAAKQRDQLIGQLASYFPELEIEVPPCGSGKSPAVNDGKRKPRVPTVKIGTPVVPSGSLDREIIRAQLRRWSAKIRYCYENELRLDSSLQGTVVVNFTVAPTGRVVKATANGVSDKVSNCVAAAVRGIKFPEPKGGGVVQVRYPFVFTPNGTAPAKKKQTTKCIDEVGCLIHPNPPACCAQYTRTKNAPPELAPATDDAPEAEQDAPSFDPSDGYSSKSDKTAPQNLLPERPSPGQIAAGLKKVDPLVERCKRKYPAADGAVSIKGAVSPAGEITSVLVAQSPSIEVGNCVQAAVRKATFSASQKGVTFTKNYLFEASARPPEGAGE